MAEAVADRLEGAGGTLALHQIEDAAPHLGPEALEDVRTRIRFDVHKADIGGAPCWRSAKDLALPDNFSAKLADIVGRLETLGKKVTAASLAGALDLEYGVRFREEYGLTDDDAFRLACGRYYQGLDRIFAGTVAHRKDPGAQAAQPAVPRPPRSPRPSPKSASAQPVFGGRRGPTRFQEIGVPIGAKLLFVKDSGKTCTVLDGGSLVGHGGKEWTISALAKHLLGVSSASGFEFFAYKGEALWDRRLRLEREGGLRGSGRGDADDQAGGHAKKPAAPAKARKESAKSDTLRQGRQSGSGRTPASAAESHSIKREGSTRAQPTRFHAIGVPMGAKLVFTKNGRVTCTVVDDSNRVSYKGEVLPISALAARLLGASSASGFHYFTYDGETLWDRRRRLEQRGGAGV
jgi:hypothetical protein